MSKSAPTPQRGYEPAGPEIRDAEHFEYSVPASGIAVVANAKPEYADERDEHTYAVNVENGRTVRCSCPADEYHDGPCKHRQAVESVRAVVLAASADVGREGSA